MALLRSELPSPFDHATFDNLPDIPALNELKSLDHWVAWNYEPKPGASKLAKIPKNPRNGFNAASSKPETWASYALAARCAKARRFSGVGFVLTDGDGYTGIDLDDCLDIDTNEPAPWARAILELGETYAEISPSGGGIRLWVRGKIDSGTGKGKSRPDLVDELGRPKHDVEIYTNGRYLTVTGHRWPGSPDAINHAPRTLAALACLMTAPDVPSAPPANITRAALPAPSGDDFFRQVNSAALASLASWVTTIFPGAKHAGSTGAWRVSPRELGRDTEEDLSIAPNGIRDWGIHDLGDAREGRRTAIDIVMEYGGAPDPKSAALWLCERMGRDAISMGLREGREGDHGIAEGILAPALSPPPVSPETGTIACPFIWRDPASIPMREWVYGGHYIRKFVSLTLAPGGVGKSSLTMVEALAMSVDRPLLGVRPEGRFRVWLWNGEDPLDELQRRMTAAILRFDINPAEVEGQLFMNSGRKTEIIVAEERKGTGTVIHKPIIDAVKEAIKANAIDVMIVDPFVSSHRVTENDNNAIDRVVKLWAKIADECNCSIELVHHVRKGTGGEVTVDDARGAGALLAGARSARVLNPMTDEEAARAGVKPARAYFRIDNGKSNLAPPSDKALWHHLEGVMLPNGSFGIIGDNVGVVTPWRWPDAVKDVDDGDIQRVKEAVRDAMNCRADEQSGDWVGNVIADALDIDISEPKERERVASMIAVWLKRGHLKVVIRPDNHRKPRKFVEAVFATED